jgi:hypothetical protein
MNLELAYKNLLCSSYPGSPPDWNRFSMQGFVDHCSAAYDSGDEVRAVFSSQ